MNTPVRLRTGVLLVTGMSGAGRSTALHLLEDLGYEAIDNVPLFLLRTLLQPGSEAPPHGAIAAGIDIRTRQFSVESFLAEVAPLQKRTDLDVKLLFLDCDDEVLARRFTQTRRRHPLAEDRPLIDGIRHEREVVAPLRAHADLVIDTSILSVPELRRLVNGHFRLERGLELTVTVTSFSYREGLPREADLVFDVRFLDNPHYDADLSPLTGKDKRVAAYVARDPAYAPFMEHLTQLLQSLLPSYSREGKTYLTIAVGCTGGRHRSVAVAEDIGRRLTASGQAVTVRHRDTDAGA